MKKTLATLCILTMLIPSIAGAYTRDSQGYSKDEPQATEPQEGTEAPAGKDQGEEKPGEDYGTGMSSSLIWGYVLITAGGLAAITGSTIIATGHNDVLGISLSSGGAAMALAGTLFITLGSHGGYAAGPSVNPKSGTYGIMVAKRF